MSNQPVKQTTNSGQQGGKQNTKQEETKNDKGKQKGNNPPQKPVDLKVLFNSFIVKEKLINGLYIPKEDKDYATIAADYKKPFLKIIIVYDQYYRELGSCVVNAELSNFKSVTKFNEKEISQFFNSDNYDLDKNTNNWNIEITITFNENLKKYNELKNVKDLKVTFLMKEIPGIYINQKTISKSHLNFKKHCETSYPTKEIITIYSSFVEDVNNFISSEKNKPEVNIVYDFKKIIDNFLNIIDKITLNVESSPSPYTILEHIHQKNTNACDIKSINNILQKLFSFDATDIPKIKEIKFNYYNNIHIGVLVALLLYYKNYTGDVMKYIIYNDKKGNNEKIYDPAFKMKTFDISKLIELLKDTTDIIDEVEDKDINELSKDELEEYSTRNYNEYYTRKYNKSFTPYIRLLQYNTEENPNPQPKSYFNGEIQNNNKLILNFQITYNTNTIKSQQFGFLMSLLTIDFDKHNQLYNSKRELIKDIQFFMEHGIKHESCSDYLLNNASQGLNSFIETSQNTISNISEKAGGFPDFSDKIDEYSKNFTKSMDIIANVLNEGNIMTVVLNNDIPVLDMEYTVNRFRINTQSLEESQMTKGTKNIYADNRKEIPIFFQVTKIFDKNIIIDDNLNEYIIKNIFEHPASSTKAVTSCIQSSNSYKETTPPSNEIVII
jgi:hypothetical protein